MASLRDLLSKLDVDRVFSLNRSQWTKTAPVMMRSRWTIQFYDRGNLIGFDPADGSGLSIHPYFQNETSPPDKVIVGTYFPLGSLPTVTDDLKNEWQSVAQKQIGIAYSVDVKHEIVQKMEIIEFVVREL